MKHLSLLTVIMFLVMMVMSLHVGVTLYQQDQEQGVERDIYNYTSTVFDWNESIFELKDYNLSMNKSEAASLRATNFGYIIGNFIGSLLFEASAFFVEVGYLSEGKYNTGALITVLRWVMFAVVVAIFFLPTAVIIYLLYLGYKKIRKYMENKNESIRD